METIIKVWLVSLLLSFITDINAQELDIKKQEIVIQSGHSSLVMCLDISMDGKTILSGSCDHTLKIWDIASSKEIRTFRGHSQDVSACKFLPGGKTILSGSYDNTLKIWDIASGTELRTFKGHTNKIRSIALLADGKTVISGSDDYKLKQWDIESGQEIKSFLGHSDNVNSVAICPDGKTLISGSEDKTIKLWDIPSGKEIKTISGFTSGVNSLAVSPDGKYVLVGGKGGLFDQNYFVELWDIESGKPIRSYSKHTWSVFSVAFTLDGKNVVAVSQSHLILYDFETGAVLKDISQYIDAIALTPDGNAILFAHPISILEGYQLRFWNYATEKMDQTIERTQTKISSVAYLPDGITAITGSEDETLKQWDVMRGKVVQSYLGSGSFVSSIAIAPDGKSVVSGGGRQSLLWDIASGKKLKDFSGHQEVVHSVAFSPDGKSFISTASDFTMRQWDVASGKVIKKYKLKSQHNNCVGFSPDGKKFISGSSYFPPALWDAKKGKKIKDFEGYTGSQFSSIAGISFSKDGQTAASGSTDSCIVIYDVLNGKVVKSINTHCAFVDAVAISSDGKTVLAESENNTIKLWDIASSKAIKTYTGHTNAISSIAISPDGKTVLSVSQDNTLRLWNMESSKLIYTAITNTDGTQWLVYNEDGYWDSSPNGGNFVAMVQGMDVWNIDQFAIKNNRPDLILKNVPNADSELIAHYYNQYVKRLKKLNLTEDKLAQGNETPEVKVTKTIQNEKFETIDFTITHKIAKATRYNIFVNDVPIFGAYGKEIVGNGNSNLKAVSYSETVELVAGENKIEISAMNELGAESFRALINASSKIDLWAKSDLYFIGFGVSKYQNQDLNLQFADKDAKDLANVLSNMKANYNQVYINTFTNEQVTVDNIKKAKELLKKAKPDDTFILFIAGHGMHDTDPEATYYYLTHNADLKNLKGTAANFETIEDLLQGIPPRNKLFLMDACESGEIDDEDQGQMFAAATGSGIASRGFKAKALPVTSEHQPATKRSYLYQKDRYIYNDLSRRSGAIVFSSSKGGELSYERSDIQNGLFTKSIITALTSSVADKNSDGIVTTDELREYVSADVAKISNDLQHPTVDRDNIYQKFGFPSVK